MTRLLEAQAVTYRVGRAELLSAVDVSLNSGELVAVIGPNGAGKSTLIDVLSGDLPPSEGRVEIGGVDISAIDGAELAIVDDAGHLANLERPDALVDTIARFLDH